MATWVNTIFSECLGWRLRTFQQEMHEEEAVIDLMGMEVMGLLI